MFLSAIEKIANHQDRGDGLVTHLLGKVIDRRHGKVKGLRSLRD